MTNKTWNEILFDQVVEDETRRLIENGIKYEEAERLAKKIVRERIVREGRAVPPSEWSYNENTTTRSGPKTMSELRSMCRGPFQGVPLSL